MAIFTRAKSRLDGWLNRAFAERVVLAFGVEDPQLPQWLESAGVETYEVYFKSEEILQRIGGKPSGVVGVYTGLSQIKMSSGDILFVEGEALRCLSQYSLFKQCELVFVRPHGWRQVAYLLARLAYYFLSKRRLAFNSPAVLNLPGGAWGGAVVRHTASKRKKDSARIYLPKQWGYADLFAELAKSNINYVVLRWWEKIPNIPINHDLDILVDDAHYDYFFNRIDAGADGLRAVDVYNVSGVNYSPLTVTYYEPENARAILQSAVDGPCGCKTPAPLQAFMALAYHALYHKGFLAGLASAHRPDNLKAQGKFYRTLSQSVVDLKIETMLDMESLAVYLESAGWQPTREKLARLSLRNDWIKAHFFGTSFASRSSKYINVFVLREECKQFAAADTAMQLIKDAGFEILASFPLLPDQQKRIAEKARGGNWADGTLPIELVVVADEHPQWVSEDERARAGYEFLDNKRMHCKLAIRKTLDKAHKTKANWLHGCDNTAEAMDYIKEVASADDIQQILKT